VLRGSESGIAVASEARRRRPEMPVIFMSGYSHDVLAGVPALEGGHTEFLQKPFFRADLERAMEAVTRS
jgi:FixJ family two-component response regulator